MKIRINSLLPLYSTEVSPRSGLSVHGVLFYPSSMSVAPVKFESFDPSPVSRLQKLIIGRLGLIFVLFLASWWWNNSFLPGTDDPFPVRLFLFLLFAVGISGIYFLLSRFDSNYQRQMRGQFFIDALLITWLVWATGDILSPYISLYIFLISVTGYFLGKNDTLACAFLSAGLFTFLSILATQSVIFAVSDEVPPSRSVQLIGFNTIAILLVGLLAARMSDKRKITEELRHTEESFADLHILHERIVESIDSGLITTDLDGRIYAFNRAAAEITGLQSGDTIGKSIFDLFGESSRKPIERCITAAIAGDNASVSFAGRIHTGPADENDHSGIEVACSMAPLLGKNGGVTGSIISFQDVTEIRALEESVRRSDRLAAVGRMAAGLAHEIRNPLGSMSSALQFLQEKVPPKTHEASLMNVVLRESDRLNSIITNFLAFARPSSNGIRNDPPAEVNLSATIEDCIALLRHSPEFGPEHKIIVELPPSPVKILASETQVKQVLWNLLQNAIQAMPGGGNLTIKLKPLAKSRVQITVSDSGKGIAPELLDHIFEPFITGTHGTGLGLSIVHRIITEHSGKIEVNSVPDAGTTFSIELPGRLNDIVKHRKLPKLEKAV